MDDLFFLKVDLPFGPCPKLKRAFYFLDESQKKKKLLILLCVLTA